MSDWDGLRSTVEAMRAGLDLEMPGPGVHRREKLIDAFQRGDVGAEAIRAGARRVLHLLERVGAFEAPEISDERAEDRPETRALIRRAGVDGMVLLKNAGALPLAPRKGARIAVIGPNAKTARAMGGGSAQLNPHYLVTPWDALREALPDAVLAYELGADNRRLAATITGEIVADYYIGRSPGFAGVAVEV